MRSAPPHSSYPPAVWVEGILYPVLVVQVSRVTPLLSPSGEMAGGRLHLPSTEQCVLSHSLGDGPPRFKLVRRCIAVWSLKNLRPTCVTARVDASFDPSKVSPPLKPRCWVSSVAGYWEPDAPAREAETVSMLLSKLRFGNHRGSELPSVNCHHLHPVEHPGRWFSGTSGTRILEAADEERP